MGKSRFNLELGPGLDEVMSEMARDQGISKAEAVRRALTGYANLRRIVSPDEELVLRKRDRSGEEQRVIIL
ncbi:ribbon-helix-helix protein, CopG family [Deinococcus sp. YIM 134068]|uniref:ribbon-helix-helix protein, CopG family n=1 Tax=Deinococcus lichenicola TaxID=3118910 RepID=UPI002F9492CF